MDYLSNQDRIKKIGKYTYGTKNNIEIKYWGEGTWLNIGSFCSISSNLTIFLGGNHRTDWATTYPFGHINHNVFNNFDGSGHPQSKGDVVIGNDVWIGVNVTIMSGITIGDGSVIAAHSIITKNVEPYSIVGGNPAKLIKHRFDKETIDILLELKWWELDDFVINEMTPYLCSGDFKEYLPHLLNYKKETNT